VEENYSWEEGGAMKVEFTCVSREPQNVVREVEIDGEKKSLEVPAVIAQLTPLKENGTGKLKVAIDEASKELFTPGNKVSVEFSATAATVPAQK
jgi:hypothetical protein